MSNAQYSYVQITGKITHVDYPKSDRNVGTKNDAKKDVKKDPTIFNIYCPNVNKKFVAVCDFYCPIRINDTIHALCIVSENDTNEILYLARPPFVQPPVDKDSTLQCLMKATKKGYRDALKIYNTILNACADKSDDDVISTLTCLAQDWVDNKDEQVLMMFSPTEPVDIKKLLNWWHKERNLRRLYLFGITPEEINASRLTCAEIYDKCMTNPYTIPSIPIEKCNKIMTQLNKTHDETEKERGAIVRIIWNHLHKNAWTGYPTKYLLRQFPNINNHLGHLKKEYGVVVDMEAVYLPFPYHVETFVARYLINKRRHDPVDYHTPLDIEHVTTRVYSENNNDTHIKTDEQYSSYSSGDVESVQRSSRGDYGPKRLVGSARERPSTRSSTSLSSARPTSLSSARPTVASSTRPTSASSTRPTGSSSIVSSSATMSSATSCSSTSLIIQEEPEEPEEPENSDERKITICLPITRISATYLMEEGKEVADDQMKAIQGALDHPISIITGAGGTGKTFCIKQIIYNLELRGISYGVCAFTGKAASRIRDVIKKKNPATIHRLITNTKRTLLDKKSSVASAFEKEELSMEFDHIIIDESSMVTMELFYDLVQAYPNVKRITFVGDANQLQTIGWGSLFYRMLRSNTIPTYKLTTNYRVYTSDGEIDGIILNCNRLIEHRFNDVNFKYVETDNFSLYEGPIERVYDIIQACYDNVIDVNDIIVITPLRKHIDIINKQFQKIYNKDGRGVTDSRNVCWKIGDKVMMTENDSATGINNGDSGIVKDIGNTAILVDFGSLGCHQFLLEPTHNNRLFFEQGTTRTYMNRGVPANEVLDGDEGEDNRERTVKKLIHSYAITIDKSQGSEWDFVIVYVEQFNSGSFLNKNRIYTAISRAKRCCWNVVSDIEAFNIASVRSPPFRCENLDRRLTQSLPNLLPFEIKKEHPLYVVNDLPTGEEWNEYLEHCQDEDYFDPDDF